jgi:hypothetical protein
VPEAIVSGETADMSPFALFKWYKWIFFRDTSVTYPDNSMVLGRDLGPAIDIGPTMTRKVLKENGQVVYRPTVRSLTPDEMTNETMKQRQNTFMEKVNSALGDGFKYEDFANNPELEDLETPIYPAYADDEDGEMQIAPYVHDDIADIDTYDQYVGASLTLPIGNKMMSARVRGRKRSNNGSFVGKANPNPIHDTRIYDVEFVDGQTAELNNRQSVSSTRVYR